VFDAEEGGEETGESTGYEADTRCTWAMVGKPSIRSVWHRSWRSVHEWVAPGAASSLATWAEASSLKRHQLPTTP